MLGVWETKILAAPVGAGTLVTANLFATLPDALRTILDLAALAILIAGFLVVGKLRAEATASKGAAQAWREERDAAEAKSERVSNELKESRDAVTELRIYVKELESRPTLDQMQAQLEQLTALMTKTAEAVHDVVSRGTSSQ